MSTKMDEDDWTHTLAVFRACLPRRGRKAEDDRRFLEALHFFTVENVRWRALPERFGPWNSMWKRFDRLSKAGVFEAFFDTLASMSATAHLIQMSTPRSCALMCRRPEQRGARRPGARAVAGRLHHEDQRKIGRLRRHHRLRPDRRPSLRRASFRNPARHRTRHSAARRHLRRRLRQQGQQGRCESARYRSRHPPQSQRKEQAGILRTHPLQGPRAHRAGHWQAQALQARCATLRKDRTKLQIRRRFGRRPLLDQIRPHRLVV
jgi:transposase